MQGKTIYEKNCYGCSACAKICPVGAIRMEENEKGFLVPSIDSTNCVHCDKCVNVCRENVKFHEKNEVYIAKLKDEISLAMSQSGGAFAAISNWILKQGGSVYGAVVNEKFEVEHMKATTCEERDKMRGSKYTQSVMGDTYCQIEKDLESNMVLFTGTPCQVAGLYKYLKCKNRSVDNLYTVDLICHGVPSVKIWRDVISHYEKKENEKVKRAVFREVGANN